MATNLYNRHQRFSYKEWKGAFLPGDPAGGRDAVFYAERLAAVELTNTFYRMPKRSVGRELGDAGARRLPVRGPRLRSGSRGRRS